MKYIIIGIGNFGKSLAEKLTQMGHEVIAVDSDMRKVEGIKNVVTHAVCLDSTDPMAVGNLPLQEADMVVVAIGENEGANILVTALMKQLKVKRLVSRSDSPLHETILEAMQVDEIVKPEEESAERWARVFDMKGVWESFSIGDFNIIQAAVPERFAGKTLGELAFRQSYNVNVLSVTKTKKTKNLLGLTKKENVMQYMAVAETLLEKDDSFVLYGKIKDIEKVLKAN